MFGVVRYHAMPEQKTMAIRFAEKTHSSLLGEALVRKAQRVANGATKDRSRNGIGLHKLELY